MGIPVIEASPHLLAHVHLRESGLILHVLPDIYNAWLLEPKQLINGKELLYKRRSYTTVAIKFDASDFGFYFSARFLKPGHTISQYNSTNQIYDSEGRTEIAFGCARVEAVHILTPVNCPVLPCMLPN